MPWLTVLSSKVPYHPGLAEVVYDIFYQPIPGPVVTNFAGAGYLGTFHTERGLTFCMVEVSSLCTNLL